MLTLHEGLVHRPRQRNDGFDLRMIAVGRVHAQQLLAGKRQDAVLIHCGAARLRLVIDGAAQRERVIVQVDQLNARSIAVREVPLVG